MSYHTEGRSSKATDDHGSPLLGHYTEVSEQLVIPQGLLLFIDLETTGLEADCDILQIASWCGEKSFIRYVIPTKSIHPQASEVNKISMCDGQMLCNGELVNATSRHEALIDFVQFVEELGPTVMLVAHNGVNFDFPRLLRQLDRVKVSLPESVFGFLDTKLVMRDLHPGLKSYRLVNLVREMLNLEYKAHDATEDARVLQELLRHALDSHGLDRFHSAIEKNLLTRLDMENKAKRVPKSKCSLESQLEGLNLNQ